MIDEQLRALGMAKCFDATVLSVHKNEIIIGTRYDSAVENVANAPEVGIGVFSLIAYF